MNRKQVLNFFYIILPVLIIFTFGAFLSQNTDGIWQTVFNLFRVILFPLGVLLFIALYLFLVRPEIRDFSKPYTAPILLWLFISSYICGMSALKFLRLNTFHYEFFDAGFYFNKIHRIMSGDFADALKIVLWEGHFQPLTILYYFLSPFTSSAEIAFLFETITLSLTAAILYKFTHHITNHSLISLLVALSYLLNPLLHFNDILGFHPDHIIVPAIIGGFYFLEIKKPLVALFCFSFLYLASEPWILSLWFIGFTVFLTCLLYTSPSPRD